MTIWIAYRVTPQLEFSVAEALDKLGTEKVIVPKISVTKRTKDGLWHRLRPVAPGYVFAAYHGYDALAAAWAPTRLVKGCHGVVGIDNRPSLLTPMDIRALYAMEVAAAEPHVEAGLKPGDKLRIKRGRHADLAAVVSRLSRGQVIASVSLFGKSHEVSIPLDQVEAA